MKYDIFISYRREGGYETAKHLNDLLVRDGYKVSFDIDTLRSGDFDTQLFERIDRCKDFILIVDKHAFDRMLEPHFDPPKDWLRNELAYALKKNKNIIPIFLSGVNGFPEHLPDDVQNVVMKNGPEYNKYHFNAFYEDLKKKFLMTKSPRHKLLFLIIAIITICACLLYFAKLYSTREIPYQGKANTIVELEHTISNSSAEGIISQVIKKRPIIAVGYDNGNSRIAGLFNENVFEGEDPGDVFCINPKLKLTILRYSEAGIWEIEKEIMADMSPFYSINTEANAFNSFEFDDDCSCVDINGESYIFFRDTRPFLGNAISSTLKDFVIMDIQSGEIYLITYYEDNDTDLGLGEMWKLTSYPDGVEDFLLRKVEKDKSVQKLKHFPDELGVNNIKKIREDWKIDNPFVPEFMPDDSDNSIHSLYVRRYQCRPDSSDFVESRDHYIVKDIGDYLVYRRWRGDVYAYDKNKKEFFLVWHDNMNYNTKYVENQGDNWILIAYIEDMRDSTTVIMYNLKSNQYYFSNKKNIYYDIEPWFE